MPRLWFEFLAFYVAAPVAIAVLLPPTVLFPVLFALTALGLLLLHVTPGFEWSDLTQGWGRIAWRWVIAFGAMTTLVCFAVVQMTVPSALLSLPREQPGLMLGIAILYPPLSALPQEIVFRPLFFRRYAAILPHSVPLQVLLNAALFSAAHLMFWSGIVAAMTFAGGLAFAHAYAVRRSFATAVALHSVAGIAVFAMGLGAFFYSGNVTRPF